MRIEVVVDPGRAAVPSLAQRVGPGRDEKESRSVLFITARARADPRSQGLEEMIEEALVGEEEAEENVVETNDLIRLLLIWTPKWRLA